MGKRGGLTQVTHTAKGMQREYLLGLDNLRKLITEIECDIDRIKREFYRCESNQPDDYEVFLKNVNKKLLYGNTQLRKHSVKLTVIDSELKLVSFLTQIRELDDANIDQEIIAFLTEFWDHMKTTIENIQAASIKFRNNVLKRLKSSCGSYHENGGISLELTQSYSDVVQKYNKDIADTLQRSDLLVRSFPSGVKQELFGKSTFLDRVLVTCDHKAFPIIRLVPDISEKLSHVCDISRQWIDKDETYLHDITKHIREQRNQSKQKENDLKSEKEKQTRLSSSVQEAYELFQTSKQKLGHIESELKILEDQVSQYTQVKQYKREERRQKEGIIGFLEISISQTKKNTTLQLKRARLMRQLKELEESLKEIEKELLTMDEDIIQKSSDKVLLSEEVDRSNSTYNTLKKDLDQFTASVDILQAEVNKLSGSVTQLEIIRTFKTSPEKVDDFYERPASVKLAPSLKETIKRKRKMKKQSSLQPVSYRHAIKKTPDRILPQAASTKS